MKLRSDSYNYVRPTNAPATAWSWNSGRSSSPASTRSATASKQPEFPREKMSHDEAQQAARLG